jgi:hypothetical protein
MSEPPGQRESRFKEAAAHISGNKDRTRYDS